MSKLIIAQSVVFLIMSESSRTSPSSNCQKMRWKWRFPPSFSWQHIVSSPQVAANQIASLSVRALTFLHNMQQEHQCFSNCNKNICSVCLHPILYLFAFFQKWSPSNQHTSQRRSYWGSSNTPVWFKNSSLMRRTNEPLSTSCSSATNQWTISS